MNLIVKLNKLKINRFFNVVQCFVMGHRLTGYIIEKDINGNYIECMPRQYYCNY